MIDEALARWLALRERTDEAARSTPLTQRIAGQLEGHETLQVLDLATGRGSNIRFLLQRLPARRQHWLAVDRSRALLDDLIGAMFVWGPSRGYEVERQESGCVVRSADRECRIEVLERDLGRLDSDDLFRGRDLVTASALLDLVSDEWLRQLAARCRTANAAGLFTITYNGRSSCWPKEPEDDLVLDLFRRHQRTDKGLGGPAAGPSAVESVLRSFSDAGYHVQRAPSDWTLDSKDEAVQRTLIDGWAGAALEIEPAASAIIADWHRRRLEHVRAGQSRISVGHDDVAAWLTAEG